MNRTILVAVGVLSLAVVVMPAQAGDASAEAKAQAKRVDELVDAMRTRERGLRTVEIRMRTEGRFPADLTTRVEGVLHVVRGEQAAIHTRLDFATGDGLRGRTESAQTKAGLSWFEDSPLAGPVFVEIDAKTVADLEWAGRVLQRDDVPGMAPQAESGGGIRRADSPLGAAVVAATRRQFDLAVDTQRTERNGEAGSWLVGPRRKGLDVQDPGVPVADRAELFVRQRDLALLEMKHFAGEQVLQLLVVDSISIDGEIAPKVFQIDGGGQRPVPWTEYPPLHEEIEQALDDAEAKSEKAAAEKHAAAKQAGKPEDAKPEVRPSKR